MADKILFGTTAEYTVAQLVEAVGLLAALRCAAQRILYSSGVLAPLRGL